MIIDFIKSWLYYPKLKKYLKNKDMSVKVIFGDRLRYAKWHCSLGKIKDNQHEPETEEDNSDGWNSAYDRKPIKSKEIITFEQPKYINVDGIKTEVEEIIIGHTRCYGYDRNTNEICEEFITRMWKLKETIPFGISKFCAVDDDGKQYICYLSENRKALIENKLLKENKKFEK